MIVDKTMPIDCEFNVKGTNEKNIEVYPEENFYIFSKRNEKQDISVEYSLKTLKAPINKGQTVGYLTIYNKGVECGKVNLILNKDLKKCNYFEYIKQIANKWA